MSESNSGESRTTILTGKSCVFSTNEVTAKMIDGSLMLKRCVSSKRVERGFARERITPRERSGK